MFRVLVLPLHAKGGDKNSAKVETLVNRLRLLFDDVAPLIEKWRLRERCERDEHEAPT